MRNTSRNAILDALAISFALLVLALVSCACPCVARAQGETTSAITGDIADATGAAVPGATVTITNRATGFQRSVKTDGEGHFNFPQLKPGAYSVKAEAPGFETENS